jgi:hypothetical protein
VTDKLFEVFLEIGVARFFLLSTEAWCHVISKGEDDAQESIEAG